MDGAKVIASIPKVRDAYDLPKLSEYLVEIKRQYPQKEDASVLLEPREGPAGWRSILAAPAGAEIALWQPKG